ncbi:MAG: DUF2127 domain-containing protein [Acidobacteriota bacterium]
MDSAAGVRGEEVTVDERTSAAGLRALASFEALKGALVLLLGFGVLSLVHKDVEETAARLLLDLHVDPERRLARSLLNAAARVTDGRLLSLAGAATAYSAARFTEAWGLWRRRVWAEWFALLSAALYLPWEIVVFTRRPNRWHAALLTGNLAIVLYMSWVRRPRA